MAEEVPFSFDSLDHTYPPVGFCIYCEAKASDVKLTLEHVIPLSLGGRTLLPQASCEPCAKITGSDEYHCSRNIFGNARLHANFPSRRKKERPAAIALRVRTAKGVNVESVPVRDHPGYTPYSVFQMPILLRGRIHDRGPIIRKSYPHLHIFYDTEAAEKFFKSREGILSIGREININYSAFSRMLAKIAFSYCVARLGYDNFTPIVQDYIRQKENAFQKYVGGGYDTERDLEDTSTNRIIIGHAKIFRTIYLIVTIRLLASSPPGGICTPLYYVVVGTLTEAQALAIAMLRPSV